MRYRRTPALVEAVQWNGENIGDVVGLAGVDYVLSQDSGMLLVRTSGEPRRWRDVYRGWWLVRYEDGFTLVSSPEAFIRTFAEDS